jgi:hypothetical protein
MMTCLVIFNIDFFSIATIPLAAEVRAMKANGTGTGKLVQTGRSEPKIDVRYDITHKSVDGCNIPEIQGLVSSNGETLPYGDCDLVVGSEILRLRHCDHGLEWLVLCTD